MKEIEREMEPIKQVHKIAGRNLLKPSLGFALKGTRKTIPEGFFDRQSVSDDDPKGAAQEARSKSSYHSTPL